jgi:hypothetical protein
VRLVREGLEGEGPFPLGPELNVPHQLFASPRRQLELEMAAMAAREHLCPPPGAPDNRGGRTLVVMDGPPLLPLAALAMGSGEVTLAFSDESTGRLLEALLSENPGMGAVVPLKGGIHTLARRHGEEFREAFSLVICALSPYLANRHLKTLSGFLKETGTLALPCVSGIQQITLAQKAATRAGLDLYSSVVEKDQAMLTFYKPRGRDVRVWEWVPGEWLSELNEEDRLIMERIAGERGDSVEGGALDALSEGEPGSETFQQPLDPFGAFDGPLLEIVEQFDEAEPVPMVIQAEVVRTAPPRRGRKRTRPKEPAEPAEV